MKPARPVATACVWCVRGLGAFLLWTLWLALGILLVLQLYVATTSELAVPGFLLRRAEQKIAESGLRVSFARTSFDPTGRVLVEDVRLSLPEFAEPVLTARAVYVRLNPWWLAVGGLEPREVRFVDARAVVPAMLSPSGQAQPLVDGLEATLAPAKKQIGITQFSGRFAGVVVSARGAFSLVPRSRPGERAAPLVEIVSTQFPRWCRQGLALADQLAAFERPSLALDLSPSDTHAALIEATVLARTLTLNTPAAVEARGLRLITRFPLLGETAAAARLDLTADELRLPLQATARNVHATLLGRLRPSGFEFVPQELQATMAELEAAGFLATAVSTRLLSQPLPRFAAEMVADVMGAPLAVEAEGDSEARAATVRFAGAVSPRVLTPLGARFKTDLRRFFDFGSLACEAGEVRLGPDWKFQKLNARVTLRDIHAYRVKIQEGGATIELDPQRLHAPDAFARIGENFARGSYEQDLRTRQYRFLLEGRLRPLEISGWFREWWPRFFQQFDFSAAAPEASVDVSGFWREGRRTSVFVAADARRPVIRDGEFDRVQTRLWVRPAFVDVLDLVATRGEGGARGRFTYRANPATNTWQRVDLDLVSTVDLPLAGKITPPVVTKLLEQFEFAQPPTVKVRGWIDSADSPQGAHQTLQIETTSRGVFRFNGFPLEDISFVAAVRDDEVLLEQAVATFGGGATTGRAKIWGAGPERRVGFDVAVKGASLGRAAAALQQFTAARERRAPEPPGKYVQEKANVRLDLAASAEGRYADPFSYRGEGNAVLEGVEIGEVPLLGLLSELLKFTALRFTSARGNFKIEGAKLAFSELNVRGSDAAIDAHGDYWLDRKELDFKAKLFPFQESGNLIKSVVGVVLSPISNVFEVKLTGTLAKPEWAFVIGPTNLLRSLAPENPESPAPTPPDRTGDPSTPATTDTPPSAAPAASREAHPESRN